MKAKEEYSHNLNKSYFSEMPVKNKQFKILLQVIRFLRSLFALHISIVLLVFSTLKSYELIKSLRAHVLDRKSRNKVGKSGALHQFSAVSRLFHCGLVI